MTARPNYNDAQNPWPSWFLAVKDAYVDTAIGDLYAQLDHAVQNHHPTCQSSGRCCKFDHYGHRLYVTGLEIAWVLSKITTHAPTQDQPAALLPQFTVTNADGCPYQIDKLCSIHTVRPMGCRIFFCQEQVIAWQNQLYEKFLSKLRTLHDTQRLEYQYMEWRAGLRAAQIARIIQVKHEVAKSTKNTKGGTM